MADDEDFESLLLSTTAAAAGADPPAGGTTGGGPELREIDLFLSGGQRSGLCVQAGGEAGREAKVAEELLGEAPLAEVVDSEGLDYSLLDGEEGEEALCDPTQTEPLSEVEEQRLLDTQPAAGENSQKPEPLQNHCEKDTKKSAESLAKADSDHNRRVVSEGRRRPGGRRLPLGQGDGEGGSKRARISDLVGPPAARAPHTHIRPCVARRAEVSWDRELLEEY
jgi:hypothetical protein